MKKSLCLLFCFVISMPFSILSEESPLFEACRKGNIAIVKQLVQKGARWNKAVHWKGFPVSQAALHGHRDVVEYFLSLGFKMNKEDLQGFTLFHWGAVSKDKGFLKWLISQYHDSVFKGNSEPNPSYLQENWQQKAASLNAIILAQEDARKQNSLGIDEEMRLILQLSKRINRNEQRLLKLKKEGNPGEEIEILERIGRDYANLNHFGKSIPYFQRALVLIRGSSDSKRESNILNRLGRAYHESGQHKKAIFCYEEALLIARENKDKMGEETALINLAPPYYAMGMYDKGYDYYEAAREIRRQLMKIEKKPASQTPKKPVKNFEKKMAEGIAQLKQGLVHFNANKFLQSVPFFEKALELMRELGQQAKEAVILMYLGDANAHLKRDDLAINYYGNALPIRRQLSDRAGEEELLERLGTIYYSLDKFTEALTFYKDALGIKQKLGDKLGVAKRLNDIGLCHYALNDFQEAVTNYKMAIPIVQELREHRRYTILLNNLALAYFQLKGYDEVLSNHEKMMLVLLDEAGEKKDPAMHGKLAAAYQELNRPEKACRYYQKALEQVDNPVREAELLRNLAKTYLDLHKYEKSKKKYQQSLEIFRQLGNREKEAVTLRDIAAVLEKKNKYTGAINYFKLALNVQRDIGNKAEESITLGRLGAVYYSIGQFQKALSNYEKRLKIVKMLKDLQGEIETWIDIGMVYFSLNQYDAAISKFNNALKSIALSKLETNLRKDTVNSWKNGRSYIRYIYKSSPFPYYSQALMVKSKLQEQKKEGKVYRLIGDAYVNLMKQKPQKNDTGNDPEYLVKAVDCFKRALNIYEAAKDRKEECHVLNNLGLTYSFSKQNKKALELFKNALSKVEKLGDRRLKVSILSNLGKYYQTIEKYDNAEYCYREAVNIAYELKLADVEAANRIHLAQILARNKETNEAITQLEEAISKKEILRFLLDMDMFKTSFFESYLKAYKLLFRLYYDAFDYSKAFIIAEKSKSVIFSEMMAKRGAREKIARSIPDFREFLNNETTALYQINKIKTGMIKARGGRKTMLNLKLEKAHHRLSGLRNQMKQKFPRYAELLYPGTMEVKKLQELLKKDETYLSYYLLDQYAIAFVVSKGQFKTIKLDVSKTWINAAVHSMRIQLQAALEAIEYVYKQDRNRFARIFSVYNKYPQAGRELYLKLFKPLESHIDTRKIMLSADEVLYGFPLEALVTNIPAQFEQNGKTFSLLQIALEEQQGRVPLFHQYRHMKYLGEKFSFAYIPSASVLKILRGNLKESGLNSDGVVAFADPVFSVEQLEKEHKKEKQSATNKLYSIKGELYVKRGALRKWPPERLPETADEADLFREQIGNGMVYKGLGASEKNVWEAGLENAKYILFSTHGFLGKEAGNKDIAEPALVLSLVNNPEEYDGLLSMTEAAGLRLNCDAVILSACNSAGESGKGGEGFAGMARSFLVAGSQAVVASHWQVESRATKMLMEKFGVFLKNNGRLPALEAARKAVKNAVVEYGEHRKIKVSYAHPYFWASFVLLGER